MVKNLAIIPARSGSKGLEDKNIRDLCGKPLMAYTIEAAVNSGCFDEVMVSTDSRKYAEIAREYGAQVPFLRNGATATDTASSWDLTRSVCYSRLPLCGQGRILLLHIRSFGKKQPLQLYRYVRQNIPHCGVGTSRITASLLVSLPQKTWGKGRRERNFIG